MGSDEPTEFVPMRGNLATLILGSSRPMEEPMGTPRTDPGSGPGLAVQPEIDNV